MKHKLTLFPILALLACSGSSLQESPPGYNVAVSSDLTAEENRLLDSGENRVTLGPDALTYTRLVATAPVETRLGLHQHYRMTFDAGGLLLCSEYPGWNEPATENSDPGKNGNPDCLFHALLISPKPEGNAWYASHDLTGYVTHGRNAVEFNNPSGRTFKAIFSMASGRTVVFNPATGEVLKTSEPREEPNEEESAVPSSAG